MVACDANFFDLGRSTFRHCEGELDAIALYRGDRGDNLSAIQTASDVLTLEFLFGFVCKCFVKGTTFRNAHFFQRFDQHVFVKLFEAHPLDFRNRGTLFHNDHQHIALCIETHIFEQPQSKQGANSSRTRLIVVKIANTKRQRGEHGTRLNALQTFDANVFQFEGLNGPSGHAAKCRCNEDTQRLQAKLLREKVHAFELSKESCQVIEKRQAHDANQ